MANIAVALKQEISRIARKEVRSETGSLKSASSYYRTQIAALKKELAAVRQELKAVRKAAGKPARGAADLAAEAKPVRFSAGGLAAQRKKLGISAREMALLLGVSQLSVYKWETGKTRPRQAQIQAISALRGLGRREAMARLEKMEAA